MKTLFLLRHAKSSWADVSLADRDRPLNQRGQRDAPRMAQWLAQQPQQPHVIVASPAVRTRATAQIMAEILGLPSGAIIMNDQIYEAEPKDLVRVIQALDPFVNPSDRVMVVGHNPGVTQLLNRIQGVTIDNVPTCGLATVQFEAETWGAIAMSSATFLSFQYPKQLSP